MDYTRLLEQSPKILSAILITPRACAGHPRLLRAGGRNTHDGWDTLVGGHVVRTGTYADVDLQAEFNTDVKQAAAAALASTKLGEGLNPLDKANPWSVFDNYIDRVPAQCVNTSSHRVAQARRDVH